MKTYKNYLGIGIITFLFIAVVGILIISKPDADANHNAPHDASGAAASALLIAEEKAFDFGNISMAAGKVSHVFKVKNTTAEPIVVEKVYTSCMCTSASLEIEGKKTGPFGMAGHGFIPKINKTITPGAEASVEAIFDPAAHGPAGVGPIARTVYLEEAGGGILELNFNAVVTP